MVRKANGGLRTSAGATRSRRRDRQRDAILRAAARLFRDRGFADTGMRDIAAAADISAANLYHYFNGKDELLYYCQDRALDRLLDAAMARRTASSAAERLRLIFVTHVRTLLDEIEGATAHLHTESLPPALRTALVRKRDRYEQALRRVIADGVRSGELVDMDPAIVTRAMLGAMNWTVTWFRPEGIDSPEVVGEVIARFLVRGIASRTPATRRTLSVIASPPSRGTTR